MRKDPLFETFLEKTSLIMLEEEIETYRHLPDVASKREFIAEFWRVRDPSPDTDENEARNEFERRVAFETGQNPAKYRKYVRKRF